MDYKQFRCMNYNERSLIQEVKFDSTGLYDFGYIFSGCSNLRRISGKINMNKDVRNAEMMFANCKSLVEFPVMNYGQLTNMDQMFYNCQSLRVLPIMFSTENCVRLNEAFYNCERLEAVELSLTNVKEMNDIFHNCKRLRKIIFSGKNTMYDGIIDLRDTDIDHYNLLSLIKNLPKAEKFGIGLDVRGLKATKRLNKEELKMVYEKGWRIFTEEESLNERKKKES